MSRIITLSTTALAASQSAIAAAKAPVPQPGVLPSLAAAQQSGSLASVEAAAVHGFNAGVEKLVYVKASDSFRAGGEHIGVGDFVQLPETEAKRLVNTSRAELATDADVAAAQKAGK